MNYRIPLAIAGWCAVFIAGHMQGSGYAKIEVGFAMAIGALLFAAALIELDAEPHAKLDEPECDCWKRSHLQHNSAGRVPCSCGRYDV